MPVLVLLLILVFLPEMSSWFMYRLFVLWMLVSLLNKSLWNVLLNPGLIILSLWLKMP